MTIDSAFRLTDRPQLRSDIVTHEVGPEVVAWPDGAEAPTYLDPVAALLAELLDGTASVEELVSDVHEALDVPLDIATSQVQRAISTLATGRLLEPKTVPSVHWAIERRLLPQPDW